MGLSKYRFKYLNWSEVNLCFVALFMILASKSHDPLSTITMSSFEGLGLRGLRFSLGFTGLGV